MVAPTVASGTPTAVPTPRGATTGRPALPYGRRMQALLEPLRRSFLELNRWFVPWLDHGFGAVASNPLTGYLMVLRTRGRRTGLIREAPLGYVILDGAVYCCAGFGETTAWYRNILADPTVEVVLPGRALRGIATPVTDRAEWIEAYRALIHSLGVVGRLTVGDVRALDDEALLAGHGAIPLVRIQPTDFLPGPLDPGGRFWIAPVVAIAAGAVALGLARRSGSVRPRGPAAGR